MRPSARSFPLWLRLALAPLVAALVLAGIWVAGGLLTNDFRVSMVLTMLWLVSARRGVAFVPASATLLGIPDVAYATLATPVAEPVELHLLNVPADAPA